MSPLPRILVLAAATLLLAGCNSAGDDAAAELETAADAVRGLDGVVDVAVRRTMDPEPVAGNFGEREESTSAASGLRWIWTRR